MTSFSKGKNPTTLVGNKLADARHWRSPRCQMFSFFSLKPELC